MQKSNTLILHEGMNALKEKLGLVDSEKFISLILRDNFDYTEWQKNLWAGKSLREIHDEAKNYFESNN